MSAILLLLPKFDVQSKIRDRIDVGRRELLNEPIQTPEDYRRVSQALTRWRQYNVELLKRQFTDDALADEFDARIHFVFGGMPQPLEQQVQELHRDIETYINRLQSILERIEIYEEVPGVAPPDAQEVGRSATARTDVFIVHGHANRESEVALVVSKLGLNHVILKDELHRGSTTLIEKLERESKRCGFAIVIITGDDVGKKVDSEVELKPRARQNVVLELGYFVALLGREKVTILHDPSVEVPSDFAGVGYYPLDAGGAWKGRVEGELRQAGLID
jgi:predicted nucleotide-binding protein